MSSPIATNSSPSGRVWAGIAAFIVFAVVVLTSATKQAEPLAIGLTTSPSYSPKANQTATLDASGQRAKESAEHLAEAKKALADGYKPRGKKRSWGRLKDARAHLEKVNAKGLATSISLHSWPSV